MRRWHDKRTIVDTPGTPFEVVDLISGEMKYRARPATGSDTATDEKFVRYGLRTFTAE
ncbi:hypothetical protein BH10PLA2_BH10PLA2_20000 [soil metagenome]